MADAHPQIRFGKVMEILLWLAGLGVLAENIFLLQQNRRLNETLAPQISAGYPQPDVARLIGLCAKPDKDFTKIEGSVPSEV
jgi:hypothetical protein